MDARGRRVYKRPGRARQSLTSRRPQTWHRGNLHVNKNDLIAQVAAKAEMSKSDVTNVIDSTLEIIGKSLKKGTDVRLVGFGTFYLTSRKASQGRNPRTGEAITIAASKVPKFKAGKALKDSVN
ncbi:MAG: HU family DNA-binding protein [Alphaproteobacteria bacterium]|nr:HU family DNA-binding protein [Alphaproteobacteria bacterium]